jgi:hypothetical protein
MTHSCFWNYAISYVHYLSLLSIRFLTYTFSHLTFFCFYKHKCDFSYICKFGHNCVLCSSILKLKLFFKKRRKSSKYYLVPCRRYKTSHNICKMFTWSSASHFWRMGEWAMSVLVIVPGRSSIIAVEHKTSKQQI